MHHFICFHDPYRPRFHMSYKIFFPVTEKDLRLPWRCKHISKRLPSNMSSWNWKFLLLQGIKSSANYVASYKHRSHMYLCVLQHRECKRAAPRRGWKRINKKRKKISLNNFGCHVFVWMWTPVIEHHLDKPQPSAVLTFRPYLNGHIPHFRHD